MDGFHVQPGYLDAYGYLIGIQGKRIVKAIEHLPYSDGRAQGVVYLGLVKQHRRIVIDAHDWLSKLGSLLGDSSRALFEIAEDYVATDHTQAEAHDRLYPAPTTLFPYSEAKPPPPISSVQGVPPQYRLENHKPVPDRRMGPGLRPDAATEMREVEDPTGYLKRVSGGRIEDRFGNANDVLGKFTDFFSPSALIRKAIKKAWHGKDPYDDFMDTLAGDFKLWARYAIVWMDLAKFCNALVLNIQTNNTDLNDYWSGKAADAAFLYFHQLAVDIAIQRDRFVALSYAYEEIAGNFKSAGSTISDLLDEIGNFALGAIVAAGADFAFGTKGLLSAGSTAYTATRVAEVVLKIIDSLGRLKTFVVAVNLDQYFTDRLKDAPRVGTLPTHALPDVNPY
ncbi:hypothetical protein ACWGE0_31565 [Lentzea sp. NPDC054927]